MESSHRRQTVDVQVDKLGSHRRQTVDAKFNVSHHLPAVTKKPASSKIAPYATWSYPTNHFGILSSLVSFPTAWLPPQ